VAASCVGKAQEGMGDRRWEMGRRRAEGRARFGSLSLCGAGRGEGLAATAQVAAPLIRPAATFSPRCAKGEGQLRGPICVSEGERFTAWR
jgi:hypothetical protein